MYLLSVDVTEANVRLWGHVGLFVLPRTDSSLFAPLLAYLGKLPLKKSLDRMPDSPSMVILSLSVQLILMLTSCVIYIDPPLNDG